jgi:hypothetical protein
MFEQLNDSATEIKPFDRQKASNYKYKIMAPKQFKSQITGYEWEGPWLSIAANGMITVKASTDRPFAWDGCSPKFRLLGLGLVGTPDGAIDINTGQSATFYASMVHDALYQSLDVIPLSRKECDQIFREILGSYELAGVYYWAVRCFGRLSWLLGA